MDEKLHEEESAQEKEAEHFGCVRQEKEAA
jgi:hypothetical protein